MGITSRMWERLLELGCSCRWQKSGDRWVRTELKKECPVHDDL